MLKENVACIWGCIMEDHYVGRNVDLQLLSEWLVRFFRNKGFRTVRREEIGGCKITVRPTYVHEIVEHPTVFVSGGSNDFIVRFVAGSRSRAFVTFGGLTTPFGGGSLFLRGVKSQEALEKLERDFWVYLEEKIDFLAGSGDKRTDELIEE